MRRLAGHAKAQRGRNLVGRGLSGVLAPGPTLTAAPAITGAFEVGETLTVSTGTWTGTGTITYAYQWLRDGVAISGATANSYTVVSADAGAMLRCRVSATDDEGTTARTAVGSIVTSLPGQFQTDDWTVANQGAGTVLTVTVSSLPNTGGLTVTAIEYQVDGGIWAVSGLTGPGQFNISGLTTGVEVDVALRVVNTLGAGDASATKAATPEDTEPPIISEYDYVPAEEQIEVLVNETGTFFYLINASPAVLEGPTIAAASVGGSIEVVGSFSVPTAGVPVEHSPDLSGVTTGVDRYLHGTFRDNAGNYTVAPVDGPWQLSGA